MISEWHNYRHLFPVIPEPDTHWWVRFNRRRRNLMAAVNLVRQTILGLLDLAQDGQTALDSLPLPVLEFRKAHFASSRSYWQSEGASYGRVPSKKQTIFGYKLHLLVTLSGVILDFELAPANEPDLAVGLELLEQHQSLTVVADKAYISQKQKERLAQTRELELLTVPRSNQKIQLSLKQVRLINQVRQIVETVNSQLAGQFKLETKQAHSFVGLCSRLYCKLTGHTLSLYFNRWLGKADFLHIKSLAFPI